MVGDNFAPPPRLPSGFGPGLLSTWHGLDVERAGDSVETVCRHESKRWSHSMRPHRPGRNASLQATGQTARFDPPFFWPHHAHACGARPVSGAEVRRYAATPPSLRTLESRSLSPANPASTVRSLLHTRSETEVVDQVDTCTHGHCFVSTKLLPLKERQKIKRPRLPTPRGDLCWCG